MPHQCTKCGELYPDAAEELLKGCKCGARFFYYIRDEKADEIRKTLEELEKGDKLQIEKDIREVSGIEDKEEKPIILDLETVRILEPGKFEIDVKNLLEKSRPLVYKLEEGKYIIDLEETFRKVERNK